MSRVSRVSGWSGVNLQPPRLLSQALRSGLGGSASANARRNVISVTFTTSSSKRCAAMGPLLSAHRLRQPSRSRAQRFPRRCAQPDLTGVLSAEQHRAGADPRQLGSSTAFFRASLRLLRFAADARRSCQDSGIRVRMVRGDRARSSVSTSCHRGGRPSNRGDLVFP